MADAKKPSGASGDIGLVEQELTRRFLLDHPFDAARAIEQIDTKEAAAALAGQPAIVVAPVMGFMVPGGAAEVLRALPDDLAGEVLTDLPPNEAVKILAQFEDEELETRLDSLDDPIAKELRSLMSYPEESAGRMMDARVVPFRGSMTAGEALDVLRKQKMRTARSLYLIDEDNVLDGRALLQDVATADPKTRLSDIAQPVAATVTAISPQEEVSDLLDRHRMLDLPVVDLDGRLQGVVVHSSLVQAVQEDATADMQTMVGASKDERALSNAMFAVKKRMPWLQINLLTAFAAAAVVGLFESTIAKYTALAVLLPVVAGQSGNAGAQALAVTMRGLALREITVRHWFAVTRKEVQVGLINGLGIAVTCGIGVFVWSGSVGLVLVIALSMVLAMIAAGFAGAVVPIALRRLGQDPATSSSIILTTVTDIAGFFSFLGIATMLSALL